MKHKYDVILFMFMFKFKTNSH